MAPLPAEERIEEWGSRVRCPDTDGIMGDMAGALDQLDKPAISYTKRY